MTTAKIHRLSSHLGCLTTDILKGFQILPNLFQSEFSEHKTDLPELLAVHIEYIFHGHLRVKSRIKSILIYGCDTEIVHDGYFFCIFPQGYFHVSRRFGH